MIIEKEAIKYGAFRITNGVGHWNGDPNVQITLKESPSSACQWEGFWNPDKKPLPLQYSVAMTGLCIWGKYDCLFKFESRAKGNPGATRSLSSPAHQKNILERLGNGHRLEAIIISCNPFGLYQSKLITWQADTVARFKIKKLYYALPVEEYNQTLIQLESFLPARCITQIRQVLEAHYHQLVKKIKDQIKAEVIFIHPLQDDDKMTVEESYVWPYQNLEIDLGIEEMEEIRIPYQAKQLGANVPPVLLGMLGTPCPYYEQRHDHTEDDFISIVP